MVWTRPHGIDNTNGIDKDSWYRIGNHKSHTYERAECYPYAGFFRFMQSDTWPNVRIQGIKIYTVEGSLLLSNFHNSSNCGAVFPERSALLVPVYMCGKDGGKPIKQECTT